MGDNSKIQWCDATWNPVTGCSPISEGCANCYASRMAARFPRVHGCHVKVNGWDGRNTPDVAEGFIPFSQIVIHPERLDQPLRWKKPRRIFVCSMGDLFHEDVSDAAWARIISVMVREQRHTFMLLTKRPEQMAICFNRFYSEGSTRPVPNIWLGVTAENQEQADKRIPILLNIPAEKRFVSIEPMLGPVDLSEYVGIGDCNRRWCRHPFLDWVIVGGETGPGARPMHPQWARDVRDQCQASGVPFMFKNWGEWSPIGTSEHPISGFGTRTFHWGEDFAAVFVRQSGRMFEGRTWEEFPS